MGNLFNWQKSIMEVTGQYKLDACLMCTCFIDSHISSNRKSGHFRFKGGVDPIDLGCAMLLSMFS